jgi:phosphatidylglycerophosphate synthase
MKKRLSIADALTYARIALILPLTGLALWASEGVFLLLYLLAVLTDALDGWVARQERTVSLAGARLDAAADVLFIASAAFWFYLLAPGFFMASLPYFVVMGLSFAVFSAVSLWRVGTIITPHLWSGKAATAALMLLLPAVLVFGEFAWLVHPVWMLVVLSRAEASLAAFARFKRADVPSAVRVKKDS